MLDYEYLPAPITDSPPQISTVSGVAENINGNTVPESPQSKVALNGNYTWRFTPGSLNYSVNYIWKAATHDSIFNEQYFVAPDDTQVDMRLSWNDAADRFTIFGYVKNLQNKVGYDGVGAFRITTPAPRTRASESNGPSPDYCDQDQGLTPPRTYGVQVQYRLK